MALRIHTSQPVIRICGCLTGVGFVLIGAYSLIGSQTLASEVSHERAVGFGVTAVIVGVIAILCSLLVEDLSNIWCRHPRRWR